MCLFCKIAKHEQKADIVFEDEKIVAFNDISPLAPVHILLIPKKHIPTIVDIEKDDIGLIGYIIYVAKKLADEKGLSEKGYKLLFRVKKYGGQEVDHIHLHLVGGAPLYEDIHALSEND